MTLQIAKMISINLISITINFAKLFEINRVIVLHYVQMSNIYIFETCLLYYIIN